MKNLNAPNFSSATQSLFALVGRWSAFVRWPVYTLLILCAFLFCYGFFLKLLWPGVKWLTFESSFFSFSPESCSVFNVASGEIEPIAGACYPAVWNNIPLLLIGRYPVAEAWRISVSFALVIGALYFALRTFRNDKSLSEAAEVRSNVSFSRRMPRVSPLIAVGLTVPLSFSVALLLIQGAEFLPLAVVPTSSWGGLALTLMLSLGAIGLGFPLGLGLALCRSSTLPVVKVLATVYIECIRGVPLVTLLFCANYLLPIFLPPDTPSLSELVRAQAALVFFSAAYLAEVIRGGLAAVDSGQKEAAAALGLGQFATLRYVVLPQALRVVLPALVSTFIGLIKDTSLVSVIGLFDLLGMARLIPSNPLYLGRYLEPLLFAAIVYLLICTSLAYVGKRFELKQE